MTILVNQAISGSGFVSFAGTHLDYMLVRLDTLGGEVRPLESASPDHVLRAGWISFGAQNFGGDIGDGVFYDAPIWLDFTRFRWAPKPQTWNTPEDFHIWVSHVRWQLSLGTTGWLFCYGSGP